MIFRNELPASFFYFQMPVINTFFTNTGQFHAEWKIILNLQILKCFFSSQYSFLKKQLLTFECITLLRSHRIVATVVYLVSPNGFLLFLISLFFFPCNLNFTLVSANGQAL